MANLSAEILRFGIENVQTNPKQNFSVSVMLDHDMGGFSHHVEIKKITQQLQRLALKESSDIAESNNSDSQRHFSSKEKTMGLEVEIRSDISDNSD